MTSTPEWLRTLIDDVREASKAFPDERWPDAWLFIGEQPVNPEEWYDWDQPLLGRPVFHSPAWITHSGYDGNHQKIVPLWYGDVSDLKSVIREFECRLAKSGDF
jgi:hypothetical protein